MAHKVASDHYVVFDQGLHHHSAYRIFHQKQNKSDKIDPTPLKDKWVHPTYNSGRVHQYTMGYSFHSCSGFDVHLRISAINWQRSGHQIELTSD